MYPIVILVVLCFILFAERIGVQYNQPSTEMNFLPVEVAENKADFSAAKKECLLVTNHSYPYYETYLEQLEFIFENIWVGYDLTDIASCPLPDLSSYKTVVIAFANLNHLGTDIIKLCDWINGGGKVLFACSLEPCTMLSTVADKLGIEEGGSQYCDFFGLRIITDFMLGSEGLEYYWHDELPHSAVYVRLKPEAKIHIESVEKNPLLWEVSYGKGHIVVNNCDTIEKITRGYITAAYSLLEDAFAYPVINSSVFFIDDFPSPVPMGNGEYILRDFKRDVDSFYTNIWWRDVVMLAKKYKLKYTGMIIESYDDKTYGPFPRYSDLNRFSYFGKILLALGGEIGYHGYNHQPLCYDGFDFEGKVDYNLWTSEEESITALNELVDFCNEVYPKRSITTYVPPSNILSAEGRNMLVSNFPQIKTLAGVYLKENYEYEQEFCISSDGIVELPRIIYGAYIDDYSRWAAFNELNFHYVSTHFWHPDDTLDEDRGAANGWNNMLSSFEKYLQWLYKSAPNIKACTASEASMAVQRYDAIGVERTLSGNELTIDITNFYDEAYFIVRIKEGKPGTVKGGTLEAAGGGLYILRAYDCQVKISII